MPTVEGETPHPGGDWDPLGAAKEAVILLHTRGEFCAELKPALRQPEGEPAVVVCENCPEDPDSKFTKEPILWRDGEGVVF